MIANIICLIINVFTNFLLPKYLSVDTYAQIKTYALLLSYAGFFSLGYNDGMYLKYGGKELSKLDQKEFSSNIYNYLVLEIVMSAIVLVIGIVLRKLMIIAFAFGVLTYNILGYFKSFYQAIGEFRLYGLSLNVEKISIFIGNIILIFIIGTDDENLYIFLQVIVGIIVSIFLFVYLNQKTHFWGRGKLSFLEVKDNVFSGFILMIGNFTSGLFTGIDRWFVKILMSSTSFAMYAFSVSVENILNTFISPITISLYNYLCKDKENEKIYKIKNYILLWITLIIACAFPIKFILEKFLTNYTSSIPIIIILFCAQIFYSIINGIYVNLYKIDKKQNFYLKQMIIMIVVSIILNTIYYSISKSMIGIALATLTTAFIWFISCEIKNPQIRFKVRNYVFIIVSIVTFLICGLCLESIVGFIVYIVVYLATACILLREYILELLKMGKNMIINLVRRNRDEY